MADLRVLFALFAAVLLLGCPNGDEPPDDFLPPELVPGEQLGPDSEPLEASGPEARFTELVTARMDAVYSVDYLLTLLSDGVESTSTYSVVVMQDNMRVDLEPTDGQPRTSLYMIETAGYLCTFGEEPACLASGPLPLEDDVVRQVESDPDGYEISELPSRTIAGFEAECFALAGETLEGAELEACYSSEGVMVYMHSIYMASETVMEAMRLELGMISIDEFTLPANPRTS